MDFSKKIIQSLEKVGITINGNKPYDIQVHDKRFYKKILFGRSLGAGESYVDGWWDCEQLDELFFRIMRHQIDEEMQSWWQVWLLKLQQFFINQQTLVRAKKVANHHYNLGNTLYELMLGKSMAYTCAYWKDAHSLDEAQYNKYDLICKKLYLKPGEKVLDYGCGFGGFAKHAAEKYGCEVVGVNISKEQIDFAKKLCKGLPVKMYLSDYRDINTYNPKKEPFEKIVSIGMFEHVGHKNHKTFMQMARRNLQEDGLFLLHAVGSNTSNSYLDPWFEKYIFPNTILPSVKQTSHACENIFVFEDMHNIGADYTKTLLEWHKNFNDNWSTLSALYDERFRRMWNYYLLSASGIFRARGVQLWQSVLSPKGIIGSYVSVR